MIGLHGDDMVYEQTTEPPTDDGSALMRQLREARLPRNMNCV